MVWKPSCWNICADSSSRRWVLGYGRSTACCGRPSGQRVGFRSSSSGRTRRCCIARLWGWELQVLMRIMRTPRGPRGARPDRAEKGSPETAVRPVADDARPRGSADVRCSGQQHAGHRVRRRPRVLCGPVCWATQFLEIPCLACRIALRALCVARVALAYRRGGTAQSVGLEPCCSAAGVAIWEEGTPSCTPVAAAGYRRTSVPCGPAR